METVRLLQGENNLQEWEQIKPILTKFAEIFNITLEVFNPHSRLVKPEKFKEDVYRIYFFSAPMEGRYKDGPPKGKKYSKVYGLPLVNGQTDGLEPSGFGIPIKDEEVIIAEYCDNTLFILFDLPHGNRNGNTFTIITKILCDFVLVGLMQKKQGLARIGLEKKLDAFKNEITSIILSGLSGDEFIEGEIEKLKKAKNLLSTKLISLSLQIAGLGKLLGTFQNDPELCHKILKIPKIRRLDVNKQDKNIIFTVLTEEIFVDFDDETYDLGCFEITLSLDGFNYEIDCRNLTNKIDNYDHPHILDGNCCFGNLEEIIPKLVAKNDILGLMRSLMSFLGSYNEDNPYTEIDNWPIKR